MPRLYPVWMSVVLVVTGVYNLVWGAAVVLFPAFTFGLSGLSEPDKPLYYPQLWQCVGMIVWVYGVGYLLAALNPVAHWPVVLLGLLGKVLGPMVFVYGALVGETPPAALVTLLFNDVIWWVPFFLILRRAREVYRNEEDRPPADRLDTALETAKDAFGVSLGEMSRRSPVLVVFLRHFGCTYCREAVTDVAERRKQIEADGTRIVMVHMGTPAQADDFFTRYGLPDVTRISDPEARLYRAFELRRASFWQLFGPKSLARYRSANVGDGGRIGRPVDDPFRMPGVFLIRHGRILKEFRHQSVADRPDYCSLAVS